MALLILVPAVSQAQPMDTGMGVDTLSLAERISLRTNILDWTLLVPNIGVEFDIRGTNWNRWSVNLNLRGNFQTKQTYANPYVYNIQEAKLEGRMYWRERRAEPDGVLRRHKRWRPWDKLMSCRVMHPDHPKTIFYRGIYAAYTKYSLRLPFLFKDGQQGTAIQAGITWGFLRSLYAYPNGNSLDLEMGLSVGAAYTKSDKYDYNREDNCFPLISSEDWHLVKHPVVNDLHLSLVYRFGNYPMQQKYRWRYDVDERFRAYQDSLWDKRQLDRYMRHYRDSVYKVAHDEFVLLYDSMMVVHHQIEQEKINEKSLEYQKQLKEIGPAKPNKTKTQKKREKALRKQEKALLKEQKAKGQPSGSGTPEPAEASAATTETEVTPVNTEQESAPVVPEAEDNNGKEATDE